MFLQYAGLILWALYWIGLIILIIYKARLNDKDNE